MYRCKVCRTQYQPEGKLNKLPSCIFKVVVKFLDQHLDSPGHLANLNKRAQSLAGPRVMECKGLCLNSHESGSLRNYTEEFCLWAAHTKLQGNACSSHHSYHFDMSENQWWLRSKSCQKTFLSGADASTSTCGDCLALSNPKSVQKLVVRFAFKYYAAKLLQKRLFSPETEVEELLSAVDATHFGQNNRAFWGKLKTLENGELQVYVRRAFASTPVQDRSGLMNEFMGVVVNPCLKMHPTAIDSNLSCLAAQFVEALSKNQQSALRHGFGGPAVGCCRYQVFE